MTYFEIMHKIMWHIPTICRNIAYDADYLGNYIDKIGRSIHNGVKENTVYKIDGKQKEPY